MEQCLRLFFNNLKNFQPTMFKYCYESAKELCDMQKPIKNLACISVYQDETNLTNLIKNIEKQNFNKEDLSIFLFLNGSDKTKLEARTTEIQKVQEEFPNLNIKTVIGEIPKGEWGFESKSDWFKYCFNCLPNVKYVFI